MVMLIISLYIGKSNCFQKWAICNSLLCDAFINLFVPLCPDCGALWDSGRGTLGQSGSFLQHDLYNVNIILADGLIVTSPLEME